jgi:hydrogenase maturation factor
MTGTPLVIDNEVREQIKACIALAEASVVDMPSLIERIKIPKNKEHHMTQMTRQTIDIPMAYSVTFSIEQGHPVGECRHMSMSVQREGRLPSEAALWTVAQEFGFWGEIEDCAGVWIEELRGHGQAINLIQPVKPPTPNEKI